MKNKILYSLLFLPVVALGVQMLRLDSLTHFSQVEVVVQGYDPKDFFAGYYMNLRPDWENTDCSQFADSTCPRNDFASNYSFYIQRGQSDELTQAVNAGMAKLVFSYCAGRQPMIVDLLVDDKSYINYVKEN